MEKSHVLNDENVHLLMDHKEALKQWCDYFEEISTEEFPPPAVSSVAPIHGPIRKINGGNRCGSEEDETGQGEWSR